MREGVWGARPSTLNSQPSTSFRAARQYHFTREVNSLVDVGIGGAVTGDWQPSIIIRRSPLLGKAVEIRSRRAVFDTQGVVGDRLVFEARITGMPI